MKYLIYMLLSSVSGTEDTNETHYNILAMDGGGIRGLIGAKVLYNVEREAYQYAVDNGWEANLPTYDY